MSLTRCLEDEQIPPKVRPLWSVKSSVISSFPSSKWMCRRKLAQVNFDEYKYTAISSLGALEMVLSNSELHVFGYNPHYIFLIFPWPCGKCSTELQKCPKYSDDMTFLSTSIFQAGNEAKMVGGRIRTTALCKGEAEKDYYKTTMADVYHDSWLPWLITRSSNSWRPCLSEPTCSMHLGFWKLSLDQR